MQEREQQMNMILGYVYFSFKDPYLQVGYSS